MLSRLMLADFKSFAEADVPLGALTLIVGTNASGKSNIRDAFRFLHGVGQDYTFAEVLGSRYGDGGVLQWRGLRGGPREVAHRAKAQFFLGARVDHYLHMLVVNVSDPQLGPQVRLESLEEVGASFWYDSHCEDDPVTQQGEHQLLVRQPRGGRYRAHGKVSKFASSRAVISQFPHRRHEPAALRSACEEVLEAYRGMRFLDLDPGAMRQASMPGQVILGDRGENLSSVLQSICASDEGKDRLLGWVRALTPMDAVDFAFPTDFEGKILVHLVEEDGLQVSAHSASDGTLRFLALVAALLSPDTGRWYFFEELDNGIHPTRLHLLLELLHRATEEQGIQVIGTTHNPALLSYLDPASRKDALLTWRGEGMTSSKLCRIADLPGAEEVLERHDLGRLLAAGWLENTAAFAFAEEEGEE